MPRVPPIIGWLAAYAVAMVLVTLGLVEARRRTIAALDTPAARAQWQEYQRAKWERTSQGKPGHPRKAPSFDYAEPPSLVLMRDYFPAILATALSTGTVFFGFFALVARGMWRQRKTAAHDPAETERTRVR